MTDDLRILVAGRRTAEGDRFTLDSGDGPEEFGREEIDRMAIEDLQNGDSMNHGRAPLADAIHQVLAELDAGAAEAVILFGGPQTIH